LFFRDKKALIKLQYFSPYKVLGYKYTKCSIST